jgi:hypothetical protein
MDTLRMTQESSDRIRAAEHRFCEALDLKVDPKTYNGDSCFNCLIGQLAIADGIMQPPNPSTAFPDMLNADGDWLEESRMLQLVADRYGVEFSDVRSIYRGVTRNSPFYHRDPRVSSDVEVAKREVVAAYMDCEFE